MLFGLLLTVLLAAHPSARIRLLRRETEVCRLVLAQRDHCQNLGHEQIDTIFVN